MGRPAGPRRVASSSMSGTLDTERCAGAPRPLPTKLKGLFAMLFVEIFGASLTVPVFTYFCIVELGLSSTYVGVVMSCFSAAQLVGAPVVGRVSDARGRRPSLLGCFLWTAVCFLATAAVQTFWELLAVRTLAGLSGGSIPVTQAMVLDISTAEERPRVLGLMGGILGIAFTMGPGMVVLALFLFEVQRRFIFFAAAIFALAGCGVGCCILEETLPEQKRRPLCGPAPRGEPDNGGVMNEMWALCTPGLVCIWLGRFCSSFAFLCLFTTYAFLIRDAFRWGDREFGLLLAISGILGAALQWAGYPPLSRALGKHTVFVLGCMLIAAYFVLLPLFTLAYPSVMLHLASKALFIVGAALVDPGVPDLVGCYAPQDRIGFAQGLTNAFRSLASVVAPLAAGAIYDVSPYSAYVLAAAVALLGAAFVACAPAVDRGPTGSDKLAGATDSGELEWLLHQRK